jgi:hypothetical protein
VMTGGLRADEESLGDLGVGRSLGDEAQHLVLATAERGILPGPVRPLTPSVRRKAAALSASAEAGGARGGGSRNRYDLGPSPR